MLRTQFQVLLMFLKCDQRWILLKCKTFRIFGQVFVLVLNTGWDLVKCTLTSIATDNWWVLGTKCAQCTKLLIQLRIFCARYIMALDAFKLKACFWKKYFLSYFSFVCINRKIQFREQDTRRKTTLCVHKVINNVCDFAAFGTLGIVFIALICRPRLFKHWIALYHWINHYQAD